jgi:hypothetical protein
VDNNLKSRIHKGIFRGMVPLKTIGGGDCFYSALSWSIAGEMNLISLFRLLTLTMIVKYADFFDNAGMR